MEISKSKINRYALLRHKKYRDKEGLFLVQGAKAVNDTVNHFEVEAIIEDPEAIRKISTLEKLPEIIAVCKIPLQKGFDINPLKEDFYLVLDGIQDPGNMGTIIRTAHWFGIKDIFCSKDTVDIYNPKVVMSTMGSISKVNVWSCDLNVLFDENKHLPVYGLLMEGENLFKAKNLSPGFILMGSEGHGPKKETVERITRSLTIPPSNPADRPDSLNVGIATAITLSQILK